MDTASRVSANQALIAALSARGIAVTAQQNSRLIAFASAMDALSAAGHMTPGDVQALLKKHDLPTTIVVVDNLTSTDGRTLKGLAAGNTIYLDSALTGDALKHVLIEELAESFHQTQIGGFSNGDFGAEVVARMRGQSVGKGSANPYLSASQNDVVEIATADGRTVVGEAHTVSDFQRIFNLHPNASRILVVMGDKDTQGSDWVPGLAADEQNVQLTDSYRIPVGDGHVPVEEYRRTKGFRGRSLDTTDQVARVVIMEPGENGATDVTKYIVRAPKWVKKNIGNTAVPPEYQIQVRSFRPNRDGVFDIRSYQLPGTRSESSQPATAATTTPEQPPRSEAETRTEAERFARELSNEHPGFFEAYEFLRDAPASSGKAARLWARYIEAIRTHDPAGARKVLESAFRMKNTRSDAGGSTAAAETTATSTSKRPLSDAETLTEAENFARQLDAQAPGAYDLYEFLRDGASGNDKVMRLWNRYLAAIKIHDTGQAQSVLMRAHSLKNAPPAPTVSPAQARREARAANRKLETIAEQPAAEQLAAVENYVESLSDPHFKLLARTSVEFLKAEAANDPALQETWQRLIKAVNSGDMRAVRSLIADAFRKYSMHPSATPLPPGVSVNVQSGESVLMRAEVTIDNPDALKGKLTPEQSQRLVGMISEQSGSDTSAASMAKLGKNVENGFEDYAERHTQSIFVDADESVRMTLVEGSAEGYAFGAHRIPASVLRGLAKTSERAGLAFDVIETAALGDVGVAVMFNPVAFTLVNFLADKGMQAVANAIGRQEKPINHFFVKHFGVKVFDHGAQNMPGALLDLLRNSNALTEDGHFHPGDEITVAQIAAILNDQSNKQLTQRLRKVPSDHSNQASFHLLALALQNGSPLRSRESGRKLADLLLSLQGERAFTGNLGAIAPNGAERSNSLAGVMDFVEWYLGAPGTHPELQAGFVAVMARGNSFKTFLGSASDRTKEGRETNNRDGGTYVGGNLLGIVETALAQRGQQLPNPRPSSTGQKDYLMR